MKFAKLLICFSLLATLTSCGGGGGGGGSNPPPTASSPAVTSSSTSSSSTSSSTSSSSSKTSSATSSSAPSSSGYPSYNTSPKAADATGMGSTATQIASKIKLGLNIGNTLEATGCTPAAETCWGNPKITATFVAAAKQQGFTAIRLPVSWDQYANQNTAQIDATWLARVKDVVQYCVDNGLYVVVNIHWDGGWLEKNITTDKQVAVNAKQKAYWEQIATTLRDFDEHVIFASANEPDAADAGQMSVLLSYHQTFVDTVRATGGKNTYRSLVVQGPQTDFDKTNTLMNQMPVDSTPNRIMAEVHYYTPSQFTVINEDASWGKMFFYWGKDYHSTTDTTRNATWGEESTVDTLMAQMKTKFIDKGIPVIVGEFGAAKHDKWLTGDNLTLHQKSRAFYFQYVSQQAIAKGLTPFYWDTGDLIDRNTGAVKDQLALDGLLKGAGLK